MLSAGVALWRREGLRQIMIVLAAFGAYEVARLAMKPDWGAATANAHRVLDLERVLSIAWEAPVQAWFLRDAPELVRAMNVFYFVGHFVLTGVFFLWLWHRSRPAFHRFRDGFLVATAVSVLIHWRFPTAPPRIADGAVLDTLRVLSGIDIGSPATSGLSNPVAAVPSLHAGYAAAVGVGVVLYARRRWARLLGVAYPAAVVLTIIVTGNHFVFDALAGVAVMLVGFAAAEASKLLSRPREARSGAILGAATRGGAAR